METTCKECNKPILFKAEVWSNLLQAFVDEWTHEYEDASHLAEPK